VKFLADEGIDSLIVRELRRRGHQVTYVAEADPGISDELVLEWANKEKAVLITADKDFGELVYRQKRVTGGVILLRLPGLGPLEKAHILLNVLDNHAEDLANSFSVVTPVGTRVRRKRTDKL
jgi:predicted nuclease of predicted toxin-antitoxin system